MVGIYANKDGINSEVIQGGCSRYVVLREELVLSVSQGIRALHHYYNQISLRTPRYTNGVLKEAAMLQLFGHMAVKNAFTTLATVAVISLSESKR
jgi:uncharacterized zinc-type alcohol dehydrogenase-like protein